jgi:hypothetical protein
MNPVVNSTRICITYVHPNDIDNKGHWSVDGMDGTLQKDTEDFKYFKDCSEEFANSEVVYALEFTKWNEWLGMDIDSETLNNVELTKADIVSHILYEMTYCGYQEEEIQEKLSTLNDRVDKIKNMTDEEFEKNTVSIDELMESLKDKIEDGR